MKKVMAILASAFVMIGAGSVFAADKENSKSVEVDHSTNPFTGTKKTVVTSKVARKGLKGADVEGTKTETTKEYKDGTVKKDTEVDVQTESH